MGKKKKKNLLKLSVWQEYILKITYKYISIVGDTIEPINIMLKHFIPTQNARRSKDKSSHSVN